MKQAWRNAQRRLWQATLLLTVLLVTACAIGKSATHPTPTAMGATGTQTPDSVPLVPAAISAALAAQEHAALIQQTAAYDVSQMSLDEQIGQMFLIETYYKTYTPDIDNMVVGMHAGALIIYQKNMQDPAQVQAYVASIQAHAHIPLLVTMDEEGGLVDRLGFLHFDSPLPAAQDVGASGNAQNAYNEGTQAAQEMLKLGINTDLAPVADVRGSAGSIETTRLYSSDPTVVTQMAGAFLNGLQSHGVVGTLKHWPGIGGVILDPHKALPTITDSQTQLESTNFSTFRQLLAEHPGMIMVTHVLVNAIDPSMPATLSPKMVDGVLRGELGYQGVVMTDSLYMQGIALRYTLPQAGVLAIEAGDDLLEGAFDTTSMSGMIAAIHDAIAAGQITPARIAESAQRILALKIRFGLLPIRDSRLLHNGASGIGFADAAPLASIVDGDLPRLLRAE